MHRFVFYILGLVFMLQSYSSLAQSGGLDSLQKTLPGIKSDTARLSVLIQIFRKYSSVSDFENANKYATIAKNEALKVIEENESEDELPRVYYYLGCSYNAIASIDYMQGRYEEALGGYLKSMEILEKYEGKEMLGNVYNNLGLLYSELSNYEKTMEFYLKSLKLREENNDLVGQASIYNNIGILYLNQDNLDLALKNYLISLELSTKINNKRGLASTQINIANIYQGQQKYVEALQYYKQALAYFEELGNKREIALACNNIGNIYLRQKIFNTGLEYHLKSLQLHEEIGDIKGMALSYSSLANSYMYLDKFDEADTCYRKSLSLYRKLGLLDGVSNVYNNMSELFAHRGDFKSAYLYHIKYSKADDSLSNERNMAKLAELNTKYESEKKAKEILSLKQNNMMKEEELKDQKNIRNILIVLMINALLLFYFFYRIKLQKQRSKAQILLLETNKKIAELKLTALQSQMNPHFIFNALNSIQDCIVKNDTESAYTYLSKFSKLLRKVLTNSEEEFITVENEIELLKLYLDLEALRFGNTFSYNVEVNIQNTDISMAKVPPMLIQPYVENAILHGLMQKQGNRELYVRFWLTSGKVVCEVEDNGIGREAAKELNKQKRVTHESIGIKNTQERVSTLNENANHISSIEIIDKKDTVGNSLGTKVILTIQTLN